ncbi:MAG: hypothetical protein OXH64_08470, partial [Rhodospirillaceae bacterium]|nr:hypothetical protein [Rhodospirillaceae bacterium]
LAGRFGKQTIDDLVQDIECNHAESLESESQCGVKCRDVAFYAVIGGKRRFRRAETANAAKNRQSPKNRFIGVASGKSGLQVGTPNFVFFCAESQNRAALEARLTPP